MNTPKVLAKTIAELEEISANYVDHGMMLTTYNNLHGRPWREVRKEQGLGGLWPLPTNICRRIAEELGWRFVRAEVTRAKNGDQLHISAALHIPTRCLAKGIGTDLLMISDSLSNKWDARRANGVSMYQGPSCTSFHLFGEENVQLFEAWYAKCYRNPDMIEAITKRGKPRYQYPTPLRIAA